MVIVKGDGNRGGTINGGKLRAVVGSEGKYV